MLVIYLLLMKVFLPWFSTHTIETVSKITESSKARQPA